MAYELKLWIHIINNYVTTKYEKKRIKMKSKSNIYLYLYDSGGDNSHYDKVCNVETYFKNLYDNSLRIELTKSKCKWQA